MRRRRRFSACPSAPCVPDWDEPGRRCAGSSAGRRPALHDLHRHSRRFWRRSRLAKVADQALVAPLVFGYGNSVRTLQLTSLEARMPNLTLQMARDLERLAAWQRINAAHADALWIWEARLLAAEQLERKATELRARLQGNWDAPQKSPQRASFAIFGLEGCGPAAGLG